MNVASTAWRVGYEPEPWAWSGWEWASHGRFNGRWDDQEGRFRTVYAGASLFACLVEVLACFRPDQAVADELDEIEEDDADAALHPTAEAGVLHHSWLEPRIAGVARLEGTFCRITAAQTISALRPVFLGHVHASDLHDFDAAALRSASPAGRGLTQAVATHLHATTDLAGVQFESRHGDDLPLWAVFERPGDPEISPALSALEHHRLTPESDDLVAAFELLGLRWADAD